MTDIRITAGVAKKEGRPNFGSYGVSLSIEASCAVGQERKTILELLERVHAEVDSQMARTALLREEEGLLDKWRQILPKYIQHEEKLRAILILKPYSQQVKDRILAEFALLLEESGVQ